jgi:nucleotide-binding universal stress UspA family protein
MTADLIISYDGTPNDDDALALGKLLAETGSSVALAYVRHARESDGAREAAAQADAERRLEHGSTLFGNGVSRHVVVGASTGEVLADLAGQLGASIIVFGSEYRTPVGRAEPGRSAQQLLEGGPVAIAVAASGLRGQADAVIKSIAVPYAGPLNDDARATAHSLAAKLGAHVVDAHSGSYDLVVVGSVEGSPAGHVALGGDVRNELSSARGSVLVLPSLTRIDF